MDDTRKPFDAYSEVTISAPSLLKGGDTYVGPYVVEGYWDAITGGSWMDADGNPAAIKYAIRAGIYGLPIDDNVLYGKVGALGHLVHVSEVQS